MEFRKHSEGLWVELNWFNEGPEFDMQGLHLIPSVHKIPVTM